jgi:hypothetical protein
MNSSKRIVYTVRDIPEMIDLRVRELAEAEDVSLNTAAIRLMERGLGAGGTPLRRRDLRSGRDPLPARDERAWRAVLSDMDVVNPADWK